MEQTSAAVVAGATPDIVRASDHNKIVTDLTELYEAASVVAPGSGYLTITTPPTMILGYYWLDNAFAIGSFTSEGYFRHPNGAPWGADSIYGTPFTTATYQGASTTSSTEVVVLNTAVALPPHAALTITKIQALLRYSLYDNTTGGNHFTLTKIGITPISIASDGTETALGAEVTTTANDQSADSPANYLDVFQRAVTADFGAGYAVSAGNRLGVRIKFYGNNNGVGITGGVYFPSDMWAGTGSNPLYVGSPCEFAFWFA